MNRLSRIYDSNQILISKQCSTCRQLKKPSEFCKRTKLRDGLSARCRTCAAKHRAEKGTAAYRKSKYNLSLDGYLALIKKQEGLCAICHQPEGSKNWKGKTRSLSVDHDHKTGKVRGLLCHSCNVFLGLSKENTATLRSAIAYLDQSQNTNEFISATL